jgi:hypothetical protein
LVSAWLNWTNEREPIPPKTSIRGTKTHAGIPSNPPGSVVGVGNTANSGQIILDGAGHVSGTESSSVVGKINSNVAFTGTYSVKSNCTGKAVFKPKGGIAVHISFELVRQMQSLMGVQTDAKMIIAGWDRE